MPFLPFGRCVSFLPFKQKRVEAWIKHCACLVLMPAKRILTIVFSGQTAMLWQTTIISLVLWLSFAQAQCPAVQGNIVSISNATVCSGQTASISINVIPASGGTFSGKFTNGRIFSGLTPVAGVINATYTFINSTKLSTTENFELQTLKYTDASNAVCDAVTSDMSGAVTLTCLSVADLDATLTTPVTICSGSSVAISVSNPNGVGGTYNQQITYNGASHTASAMASNQIYGTLNDVLTNSITTPITVQYIFTPISPSGCNGVPDTVYVTVNPKPIITCPGNKTQSTDANTCTATVNNIDPILTTTAACNGVAPVISYKFSGVTTGSGTGSASGKTFNKGLTAVTYYITDASNNKDSCQFTISINDTQPPVFTTCPSNTTVSYDSALCGAVVNFNAVATDNCTDAVTIIYSKANGSVFPIGVTPVTITATDAAGKKAVCSFSVTVTDSVMLFVNDASQIGDVYTMAAGNDLTGNGSRCAPYATIQKAIAAAKGNGIIYVDAGTYREDIVVDKKLILKGANYGRNPNGLGPFAKASVVQPLTSNPTTGSSILYLESNASSSLIDGFTFDGDNTTLTSGVVINGADIDAAEAIGAYAGIANTTISNNIIKNLNYAGVNFDNFYTNSIVTTGNSITNNQFLNIIPAKYGTGITIANNCYTSITNNKMDSVRLGVQVSKFFRADPGNSHSIVNNTITSSRTGIWHYFMYADAASFDISSNTINTYNGAANNNGILIDSVLGTVGVTILNNKVNGAYAGINLYNNPTTNTIAVNKNIFTSCSYGVFANNYDGFNASAQAASNYWIKGTTIQDATVAGIYVKDNGTSSHQAVVVQISDSTVVNTTVTGLKIEGSAASVIFNGSNPASFIGQGIYINQVSNSTSVPGATLNATNVLFDGLTGATATIAQNFAIEDKINHKIDSAALGFVLVKAKHDYVTLNSHLSTGTIAKIQRGVLAADTGFIIHIAPGTFNDNVIIDKQLTIQGSGMDSTQINSVTASGNIITVSADSVAINDVHLKGAPDTVTNVSATRGIYFNKDVKNIQVNNIKASEHQYGVLADNAANASNIRITGSSYINNENGFGVNVSGKVVNLTITNTAFNNNRYGITSKADTVVSANNQNGFMGVVVTNSTFKGNTTKGMYFEKLSNAVLGNNTFINNGIAATGTGLELNLQNGTYTNISINGNVLTNNGDTLGNGSAIAVKARNDAPGYNNLPASLSNVMITNNEVTTAPIAIAVGYNVDRLTTRIDSNKIIATKGIMSWNAAAGSITQVHNNSIIASQHAVMNGDSASVVINATCNWLNSTDPTTVANKVDGAVMYVPYLSGGSDNQMEANGFQPKATCAACTTLTATKLKTNITCNGGTTGTITVTAADASPYLYTINPVPVTMVQPATGQFTGLPVGIYTITGYGANGCSTVFEPDTISQPIDTLPDASVSIPSYTDSVFQTIGSKITFLARVTEKAGNPITTAVLNLTKQEGYTMSFSPALQSLTIKNITYPLDNAHWTLDSSNPNFSKLTLANSNQVACLQSVYLAITLTRTDPNKAKFVLTSFLNGINGELIRNNNSTTFSLVGQ